MFSLEIKVDKQIPLKEEFQVPFSVYSLSNIKIWKLMTQVFSQNLGSLTKFKGLRSKLELEQLVICDTIIAELGRQILLYDHSINQCKGFTYLQRQ